MCACLRRRWESIATSLPCSLRQTQRGSPDLHHWDDSRHVVPIDIIALDDYFKSGQRVDLIKMDIQGYELHALRGGQRVLEENPDINLLLEFWPSGLEQAGVGWEGLIETILGFSMDVTVVRTSGLVPFDTRDVQIDVSWYVNLFAHRRRGRSALTGSIMMTGR